jgi:hypothetical protein
MSSAGIALLASIQRQASGPRFEVEVPHRVRNGRADREHRDQDDQQRTARLLRRELRGDRARDGEVGADGDAHQGAQHDQLPWFGGQELQRRQDDKARQVGDVNLLPAELVRHGPEDQATEEHAHQRGRSEKARLDGAQ